MHSNFAKQEAFINLLINIFHFCAETGKQFVYANSHMCNERIVKQYVLTTVGPGNKVRHIKKFAFYARIEKSTNTLSHGKTWLLLWRRSTGVINRAFSLTLTYRDKRNSKNLNYVSV